MNDDKFRKPERKSYSNPIEAYNITFNADEIVAGNKNFTAAGRDILCAGRPAYKFDPAEGLYKPQIVDGELVTITEPVTPFQLLTHIRFKNNYRYAFAYVEYQHYEKENPYIRVGDNYYKKIIKKNHWDITHTTLKMFNKSTIIDDYGKSFISRVPRFDDFTIYPDNINYKRVVNGMYNLYEPFPWKEHDGDVTISDIPVSASFMAHIFGEQEELGYKYMKVLYEYPKQILPVLSLVSRERETGKTSFINWLEIIFGDNTAVVNPEDMTAVFNAHYAYKNIICIDETIVEKQSGVERIKSLATQRTINVNEKMASIHKVPFYGKIVLATNKATDFIKIDFEEIRFWVRYIGKIKESDKTYGDFYQKLINEVPKFLKYLRTKIDIEINKSRMVLSKEEIANDQLELIKENSRPGLYKEIKIRVQEWFRENSNHDKLYMRLKDIKQIWFDRDSRISSHYIRKVLNEDFEMETLEIGRYRHFGSSESVKSTPFCFDRKDFLSKDEIQYLEGEITKESYGNGSTPF